MSENIELDHAPIEKKSHRVRSISMDNNQHILKPQKSLRHTQSHSSLHHKTNILPVLEEVSDEQKAAHEVNRKLSNASGCIIEKNTESHGNFKSSRKSSHASQIGSVNHGYIPEHTDHDRISSRSRYSSNPSLSTIKEQYCCSPNCRFTPRERKLCALIGVLAAIIIILVAVVGYLADHKGVDNTFSWKF